MVEVTTENIIQKIKARAPALLEKLGSIQILDFKSFQTFSEKYIDDSAEIKSRILNSSLQTLDTETLTNILLNPSAISLFDLIYFENLVSNAALKKLEVDNKDLKKALTTKEAELETMTSWYGEYKQKWQSLTRNFNSATEERKRYEKNNVELTEEKTKLIQELKVANDLSAAKQNTLIALEIENKVLRTKLKDITDEKEKINKEQHNKNSQGEDIEEERKNGKRTKPQQSAVYARTSEELELMRMDLIEMPQCAERSLNELIYWVSSVSPSKDEIVKELKEFEAHLIKEELNSATVTKSLEQIKAYIKNQCWNQAGSSLDSLLKEMRPLNIPELIRLVEKAENAGKILEGKKAILLLGETGAGKSTTIHFLCGSKLTDGQDAKGLDHIYPEEIYNEAARMITTSAISKSETRYITAVPLDDPYVICDTSGFEDTSGAEVDIGNGIAVIKAIMKCNAVKPVFLISSKGLGDRLQGLKRLASTVIKIMPQFSENMDEITYFFTKFSEKEAKGFGKRLEEVKESMTSEEKANKGFVLFFDDVLDKYCDPKGTSAKFIDPIEDDSAKVLKLLKNSKFILKPDEVFKPFITDKSLGVLKQQLHKHKNGINRASENHNYEYIAYRLDQLKKALEFGIGEKETQDVYDQCVRRVITQINEQYTKSTEAFNRRFSSQLEVAKEDIYEYKRALENSKKFEPLRKPHLGGQIIQNGAYIQNLKIQIDHLKKIFSEQVKSLEDLVILKSILNKMRILGNEIGEQFINLEMENMLKNLREKMQQSEDVLKKSISAEAFDIVSTKLTELSKLNDLLQSDQMKVNCDSYRKLVMDLLNERTDNLNYLLDAEAPLRKEDIQKIYSWCDKLHLIQDLFHQSHHPVAEVKENYESFAAKLRSYADKLVQKISEELKKTDSSIDFKKIESLFKTLNELKNIPKLENRMYPAYSMALDVLSRELREFKRTALSSISHLSQSASAQVDHKKLSECLTYLEQAKWIDDFQPGICEEVTKNIQAQIVTYVKNIKISTEKLRINVRNHDKLKNASELMSNLISLRPLGTNLPDLKKEIDDKVSWFKSIMDAAFDTIKENFLELDPQNIKAFDPQQAENALNFVDICNEMLPTEETQATATKDTLEMYLKNYFSLVSEQVMTEFNAIIKTLEERREESKQPEPIKILVIVQKLRQNVNSIGELLMIIRDIKANYPSLTSYFPKKDMIDVFSKILARTREDITTEIGDCNGNIERIHARLPLLKVLSNLDEYVQGEKFSDLFKQYQDLYYKSIMGLEKEAMEKFKNLEFHEGVDLMSQLDTKSTSEKFQRLKRDLESFLNELVDEYRTKAATLKKDIPIDELRAVISDLRTIAAAKQQIPSEYRNKIDSTDILKLCTDEIKQILINRLKQHLVHLRGMLEKGAFSGAEGKIDHITRLKTMLNPHLQGIDDEIFNQIDNLINWYAEDGLKELNEKYKTLDLMDYVHYPPKDIFSAQNDHPHIQDFNELTKTIQKKCLDELENAKNYQPPSVNNPFTAKVEAVLDYLPEALRKFIKKSLADCKIHIRSELKKVMDKLDKIANCDDLREIKDSLESFQKSGNSEATEMIIQKIQSNIGELISKVKENFQQHRGKQAFDLIRKLRDSESLFSKNEMCKARTSKFYLEVSKVVQEKFEELCRRLSEALVERGDKESDGDISLIGTYMECVFDFKDYKDSLLQSTSFDDSFLPINFNHDFNEVFAKLADFVQKNEANFSKLLDQLENLDDKDLHSLLKLVEKYQKLNSMIEKFKKRGQNLQEQAAKKPLEKLTDKIKKAKETILTVEFGTSEACKLEAELTQVCKNLNFCLVFLKTFQTVKLDVDVYSIYEECLKSLTSKIIQINASAWSSLKSFLLEPTISIQEGHAFSNSLRILSSFQENVAIAVHGLNLSEFEKPILDRVREIERNVYDSDKFESMADSLILIKCISQTISSKNKKIDSILDEILQKMKARKQETGGELLARLGVILSRDRVGKTIISNHKIFEGYALSLFNQKVQAQDIIYVLKNIQGDNLDTKKLDERYRAFILEYSALVENYLGATGIDFDGLIEKLKVIVSGAISRDHKKAGKFNRTTLLNIPSILAHIFATWTLMNSHHYFDASNVREKQTYLFKPHPAQVVSIFRIFGTGDEDGEKLKNNLVEIKTGEGKSVTLAAASCVFALLGYDVSCACYSEYLNERDEKAFLPLFEKLNLQEFIHYGTFNKLCENVINEGGDIRRTIESLILPNQKKIASQPKNDRPKILLIDEVDVFFKEDFYGNLYNPVASLTDDTIKELARLIWNKRSISNLSFTKHIQSEQAFINCSQKFKEWEELIVESTKDMISDVKTMGSDNYIVQNDKIGYKEQDKIAFNIVYGYKTLFAYFQEREREKISPQSLEENICIRLKCGSYSYAEIPKKFNFIAGVTGTLRTLNEFEKKIIKDTYKIKKCTFTPSVFGKNNNVFSEDNDISIVDKADYHSTILREIEARLVGKNTPVKNRAVLVFFESEETLMEFRYSHAFLGSRLKTSTKYLTEKANDQEKEQYIREATNSGQVTLFTRTFGRGTDFILNDPVVENNNGIHVLQTFLSEDVSEYHQIRGRTARQGGTGSYSMVLLDQSLESRGVTPEEVQAIITRAGDTWSKIRGNGSSTIHSFLDDRRNAVYNNKNADNSRFVEEALKIHNDSYVFLNHLHSSDLASVKRYLIEKNKGAETEIKQVQTLCLMDATGSMTNLLHKAKTTVGTMYDRITDILANSHIPSSCFQLQFGVYRNYNCPEDKILQVSTWESKPDALRTFMETIGPEGGWGNEAIEIGLSYARQEAGRNNNLAQIILIGDMPPNERYEVSAKRAGQYGDSYWQKTKFSVPTYWEEEVEGLKKIGVPIYAFYLEDPAAKKFSEIAERTGGECRSLNVNSAEGAADLTACVSKRVLKSLEKTTGNTNLAAAYDKKYGKAFF